MKSLIIVFASLFSFSAICIENKKQNDYSFIMQYANITVVNPKYVEVHECLFRKFNRTAGGLSIVFSFKEDFDNSFSLHIRGFLFKNNEFKQAVINFNLNLCDLIGRNLSYDVEHILERSNLTLSCPIKKGTYYVRDMVPDATNFPSFLPSGFWYFKEIFRVHGEQFAVLNMYAYVDYKV